MSYDPHDTICAIATATGGAASGMVRVSGPQATYVIERLFHADDGQTLAEQSRATAISGSVSLCLDNSLPRRLPCDLYLWPTARSYTRQPVAELHTIGSPPLLEAMMTALCGAGARVAEPGEFTLRAFLAGRLDLTQAEAVLGVIDARGSAEFDSAVAQLAGGLARPLHQLREQLLQLLAELEAGLDFVDEDIEFVSLEAVSERLEAAKLLLEEIARQMASRHTASTAAQVAIVGPPNVGKSSLFNAMVKRFGTGRDNGNVPTTPALVSPTRGTTRDYLTATIDLSGLRCELVDTAGVDDIRSGDALEVEAASQASAAERRKRAAVRIHCVDGTQKPLQVPLPEMESDVVVMTKADLVSGTSAAPVMATSSLTGTGLDALARELERLLKRDAMAAGEHVVAATAERCRESIGLAAAALQQATEIADARGGDELVAAEIRAALAEIGKVVGSVYTDDLLDRIFSTFCIGK